MVRSLNMLVYELIELYRANHKVTDSYDERIFATWIQATRAKLLKQRLVETIHPIDSHWVQHLGVVEMETIDSSIATVSSEKMMLKSKRKIPWTIHTKGNIGAFTRLGPADRFESNFRLVTKETALTSGNGKFNKSFIYAFLDDGYLFLKSKNNLYKQLFYLDIAGVFENPIDAYDFNHGEGTYDWDMEYPISESIVNDMKNIIVQENFQLIMVPIDSKKSNSIDNISNPPPEAEGGAENPMRRRR